MEPKILGCSCKHEYQDEKYGNQKRVHNPTGSPTKITGYRCTVCGLKKST